MARPRRRFGLFPKELLREAVPVGDLHTEEERRLLYVAITRARETLVLTTHGGPTAQKGPSQFVGELREGAGPELLVRDRSAAVATDAEAGADHDAEGEHAAEADAREDGAGDAEAAGGPLPAASPCRAPVSGARSSACGATELLSLLEGVAADDPEAAAARAALVAQLAGVGEAVTVSADAARAAGLDPLTLRTVAADAGVGASLLAVAPLPSAFSY